MTTTFKELPFDIQDKIFFMKHQLEMEDVFKELILLHSFNSYKNKVNNQLDNMNDTSKVGKWCEYYKWHMREVFNYGNASLEDIMNYCDKIKFDENELYDLMKCDVSFDCLAMDDIQEALECALIIRSIEDDDSKSSDEEEEIEEIDEEIDDE